MTFKKTIFMPPAVPPVNSGGAVAEREISGPFLDCMWFGVANSEGTIYDYNFRNFYMSGINETDSIAWGFDSPLIGPDYTYELVFLCANKTLILGIYYLLPYIGTVTATVNGQAYSLTYE